MTSPGKYAFVLKEFVCKFCGVTFKTTARTAFCCHSKECDRQFKAEKRRRDLNSMYKCKAESDRRLAVFKAFMDGAGVEQVASDLNLAVEVVTADLRHEMKVRLHEWNG